MDFEKLAKSYDAKRKKQYWQMLKKLHGGSDEAIKSFRRGEPANIYHGTNDVNDLKGILESGLKGSGYGGNHGSKSTRGSVSGKGVYFGNIKTGSRYTGDAKNGIEPAVRLKRPSEFSKNDKTLYPKTTKVTYMNIGSASNKFNNTKRTKNPRLMSDEERHTRMFSKVNKMDNLKQFVIRSENINPELLKNTPIKRTLNDSVDIKNMRSNKQHIPNNQRFIDAGIKPNQLYVKQKGKSLEDIKENALNKYNIKKTNELKKAKIKTLSKNVALGLGATALAGGTAYGLKKLHDKNKEKKMNKEAYEIVNSKFQKIASIKYNL